MFEVSFFLHFWKAETICFKMNGTIVKSYRVLQKIGKNLQKIENCKRKFSHKNCCRGLRMALSWLNPLETHVKQLRQTHKKVFHGLLGTCCRKKKKKTRVKLHHPNMAIGRKAFLLQGNFWIKLAVEGVFFVIIPD